MVKQEKNEKKEQREKKNRKERKEGGSGASDYAIQVFGSAGQQTAVSGSNVIAMKHVGGSRRNSRKTLRLLRKNKRNNRKSAKKLRGGDEPVVAPVETEPVVAEEPVVEPIVTTENAVVVTENKPAEEPVPQNGGYFAAELAVPAILLTANQLYRGKKGKPATSSPSPNKTFNRRRSSFNKSRKSA